MPTGVAAAAGGLVQRPWWEVDAGPLTDRRTLRLVRQPRPGRPTRLIPATRGGSLGPNCCSVRRPPCPAGAQPAKQTVPFPDQQRVPASAGEPEEHPRDGQRRRVSSATCAPSRGNPSGSRAAFQAWRGSLSSASRIVGPATQPDGVLKVEGVQVLDEGVRPGSAVTPRTSTRERSSSGICSRAWVRTVMWSAALFAFAFPGRSSPARHSPVPPSP